MHLSGLSDGFFWVICGLGLVLVLTAALAFWSAARLAGEDDRRLERTKPRPDAPPPARRKLRKTDRR